MTASSVASMTSPGPRELRLPGGKGGRAGAVTLGLAAALACAAVILATAAGPVTVVSPAPVVSATGASVPPSPLPTSATATSSTSASGPPFDPSSLPSLPDWAVTMIRALAVVIVLWVAFVLARAIWRHLPRLRTRTTVPQPMSALPEVPEELAEGGERRLTILREGNPRNAIVACWLDLEQSAAAAGLPRDPAETSAEYTVRVLHTWDVAPDAMGRLAALYREARFSAHPLTEGHRDEAVTALTRLQDDVARIVAGRLAEATS